MKDSPSECLEDRHRQSTIIIIIILDTVCGSLCVMVCKCVLAVVLGGVVMVLPQNQRRERKGFFAMGIGMLSPSGGKILAFCPSIISVIMRKQILFFCATRFYPSLEDTIPVL